MKRRAVAGKNASYITKRHISCTKWKTRTDNGCSFIYLYTIIYQQFRTRWHTKYQLRRVLVNNADLQCPMAQSSLEGPLKENCFLPSELYKLGLHDWLIEVCSECCIIPSFGVNAVVCLRSTAKGQGGNSRVC